MAKQLSIEPREAREKAKKELSSAGGLSTVSKTLAQQLQLSNLKFFGSEKDEDVDRREDWLSSEEFADSRKEMKSKLNMLIDMLESSDNVAAAAAIQKEKIQALKDKNLVKILEKTRPIEKAWRELGLYYTNAAQREMRNLVVLNANTKKVDATVLTNKITRMIDEANYSAIDQSKCYSMLVAPNFIGRELIEKLSSVAYKNKILFMTDYQDLGNVDDVMEAATDPDKPQLGGVEKVWSRTVVFSNYTLLRDKYAQERRELYGSPVAAVAGKMYSIENIAQPIAGAQYGPLKGLNGIRFKVSQEQANTLDTVNLNPLTNAFGVMMPFNCVTMFKGENVELRQYSVIRTLDYVDRLLKHFLNQYVFTSMLDAQNKIHVRETIKNMMDRLVELKILKKGRLTYFDIDKDRPDRFNIKLEVVPMFVVSAFEYTIGIDQDGLSEGEDNV